MPPTATAKRVKVAQCPSTQSNLRELFAKQNSSPLKKTCEETELEWAIQESLRESQSEPAQPPLTLQHARQQSCEPDRDEEEKSTLPVVCDVAEGSSSSSRAGGCHPVDKEDPPPPTTSFNAFSRLMSSHSEAKEWAAADVAEARNYGNRSRQRKSAPFYKILTGMPICVDGFRFGQIDGCKAYFLSHFHADHYGGITSTWEAGPIYCSQTTANLVRTSLHVQEHLICPLPFDIPTLVPGTGGVRVTLLDANHCPGSCLFLFEGPQTCHILSPPPGSTRPSLPPPSITFRYLHCGDFRASPRHTNHPLVRGKRLDIIYLDTTYCNPRYCFPAQEMVVQACAEMVHRAAPEQCKMSAPKEEQEDWTVSPLKGKRLKEALEVEENKPSADALKGWLEGGKKRGRREEDEEELGELEFRDEEVDFKAPDEMGEDDEGEGVGQECEGGDTPTVCVKKEEGEEDEGEAAAVGQECEGGDAPTPCVKREEEEEGAVLLEEDAQAGLGGWIKEEARVAVAPAPTSPRVLVVVGTYTIGKEKIVIACAKALGTKVFCADSRKYRVYAQLEDAELHSLLTRDPLKANVHVTSLMTINGDALKEHTSRMRAMGMQIDRAIAFRPTGWTYKPPAGADVVSPSLDRVISWNQARHFDWSYLNPTRDSSKEYSIYGVPYSEHSSFFELTAFALSVDYVRIIATVNVGNPNSRGKMARWFEKWVAEKKRRNGRPVEARTEDYF